MAVSDEAGSPHFPHAKSEPTLVTLSSQPQKPPTSLHRKKTYSPHMTEEYYDPRMVLQLIISQPCHAYMGIAPNLRPLIELTIKDLREEKYIDANPINAQFDKELIDEVLIRLKLEQEFTDSFVPLQASIQNFEIVLKQTKYTFSLIKSICHALIGSFLSGYNTSLLNVPAILIQSECHLNTVIYSSLQSFYCVGGLFGALSAGYMADKFGRKLTLIFANTMFMASGVISILYTFSIFGPISDPNISFIYFIISRIVSGLASGISTAMVPTYLGEIAPAIIRGEIGTLNAFINAFGILFAEFIGFQYILGSKLLWKWIFIMNIIPGFIQLIFINSFCESPQWLLYNGKKEGAKKVFQWLRETEDVVFDMRSIKTKRYFDEATKISSPRSIQKQTSRPKTRKQSSSKMKDNVSLLDDVNEKDEYGAIDLVKGNDDDNNKSEMRMKLFYIFFITICLQILQQFSGINRFIDNNY